MFVKRVPTFSRLLILALLFIAAHAGCDRDKNPVEPTENHNEAEGLVLKLNNQTVVTVKEGKVEQGQLTVKINKIQEN